MAEAFVATLEDLGFLDHFRRVLRGMGLALRQGFLSSIFLRDSDAGFWYKCFAWFSTRVRRTTTMGAESLSLFWASGIR